MKFKQVPNSFFSENQKSHIVNVRGELIQKTYREVCDEGQPGGALEPKHNNRRPLKHG
jgi:hypothetical protein